MSVVALGYPPPALNALTESDAPCDPQPPLLSAPKSIASTGVAVYFGEATMKTGARASTQNMVRGLFGGGSISPTQTNAIDMITIQTSGNATDFGDLTRSQHSLCGMCDSHGGLGGY